MTMTKQPDKEGRQGEPSARPRKTSKPDRDVHRDPDVYDPVGMAGKKAGIVKVIEEAVKGPSRRKPGART